MTYSIVARCPRTGRLGVAVQTRSFAVGQSVPWARAGVGAVATQASTKPSYGQNGLRLMESGLTAEVVLKSLLAADEESKQRQVAFVDAQGGTAAHTGAGCIAHAAHIQGDGVVFQANLMLNPGVPEEMQKSWHSSGNELLEDRLLMALLAAEKAGGDIRGQMSAAMKVVGAHTVDDDNWATELDLRIDDDPRPLEKLSVQLTRWKAQQLIDLAQKLIARGKLSDAAKQFVEVRKMIGDTDEVTFTQAISLARFGPPAAAREALRALSSPNARMTETIERYIAAKATDTSESIIRTK